MARSALHASKIVGTRWTKQRTCIWSGQIHITRAKHMSNSFSQDSPRNAERRPRGGAGWKPIINLQGSMMQTGPSQASHARLQSVPAAARSDFGTSFNVASAVSERRPRGGGGWMAPRQLQIGSRNATLYVQDVARRQAGGDSAPSDSQITIMSTQVVVHASGELLKNLSDVNATLVACRDSLLEQEENMRRLHALQAICFRSGHGPRTLLEEGRNALERTTSVWDEALQRLQQLKEVASEFPRLHEACACGMCLRSSAQI